MRQIFLPRHCTWERKLLNWAFLGMLAWVSVVTVGRQDSRLQAGGVLSQIFLFIVQYSMGTGDQRRSARGFSNCVALVLQKLPGVCHVPMNVNFLMARMIIAYYCWWHGSWRTRCRADSQLGMLDGYRFFSWFLTPRMRANVAEKSCLFIRMRTCHLRAHWKKVGTTSLALTYFCHLVTLGWAWTPNTTTQSREENSPDPFEDRREFKSYIAMRPTMTFHKPAKAQFWDEEGAETEKGFSLDG
jgi:hypothetical protein